MNSTFNDRHHPKSEPNENSGPSPSLKVNKHSHVIKKPPSPSSTSVVATGKPRQPVIIYTHIPRIIHTNPKDFMALVQNLTGMSRSDQDPGGNTTTGHREKSINRSVSDLSVDKKVKRNLISSRGHNNYHRNRKGILYNNESSSVITKDENIMREHGQFNSSQPYSAVAIPPPPPLPPPSSMYGTYFSTYPISPSDNPTENFLSGNQLFDDPLYLSPNMMNSFSSSSWFDGFEFL